MLEPKCKSNLYYLELLTTADMRGVGWGLQEELSLEEAEGLSGESSTKFLLESCPRLLFYCEYVKQYVRSTLSHFGTSLLCFSMERITRRMYISNHS